MFTPAAFAPLGVAVLQRVPADASQSMLTDRPVICYNIISGILLRAGAGDEITRVVVSDLRLVGCARHATPIEPVGCLVCGAHLPGLPLQTLSNWVEEW